MPSGELNKFYKWAKMRAPKGEGSTATHVIHILTDLLCCSSSSIISLGSRNENRDICECDVLRSMLPPYARHSISLRIPMPENLLQTILSLRIKFNYIIIRILYLIRQCLGKVS